MPIYIRFTEIKGKVTAEGHDAAHAGGATGGVWKTTNFLTENPMAPRVSRISFNGHAVDERIGMLTTKAEELFRAASDARNGTLYVATDNGVYAEPLRGHTRLIFGDDHGVWNLHNTGALRNVGNNNMSRGIGSVGALQNVGGNNTWAGIARPGQGVLKSTDSGKTWRSGLREYYQVVDVFVSDPGSSTGRVFRMKDVTISPTGGGPTASISMNFQKIEFQNVGMK